MPERYAPPIPTYESNPPFVEGPYKNYRVTLRVCASREWIERIFTESNDIPGTLLTVEEIEP